MLEKLVYGLSNDSEVDELIEPAGSNRLKGNFTNTGQYTMYYNGFGFCFF